jgi:hypothetical protein
MVASRGHHPAATPNVLCASPADVPLCTLPVPAAAACYFFVSLPTHYDPSSACPSVAAPRLVNRVLPVGVPSPPRFARSMHPGSLLCVVSNLRVPLLPSPLPSLAPTRPPMPLVVPALPYRVPQVVFVALLLSPLRSGTLSSLGIKRVVLPFPIHPRSPILPPSPLCSNCQVLSHLGSLIPVPLSHDT